MQINVRYIHFQKVMFINQFQYVTKLYDCSWKSQEIAIECWSIMLGISQRYYWSIFWSKFFFHEKRFLNLVPCNSLISKWFINFGSLWLTKLIKVSNSHKLSHVDSEKHSKSFLFQSAGISIQRGNVVCILGTFQRNQWKTGSTCMTCHSITQL